MKILFMLLVLFSLSCSFVLGAFVKTMQIDFSFTPSDGKIVSAYRLYQEGIHVRTSTNIITNSMTCSGMILTRNTTGFTMDVLYSDNSSSPQSPTYNFTLQPELPPDYPVVPPVEFKMIITL